MTDEGDYTDDAFLRMLSRSSELHEKLLSILDDGDFGGSPRHEVAFLMCSVGLEHATALRMLMASGLPNSAVSMMRLQFDALPRAMWLVYAAPDSAVNKLLAPLNAESERIAGNLPSTQFMIDQIGRQVGENVPAAAHQMLVHFKEQSSKTLNSYVHAGIHALRRTAEGFPVALACQVMRISNALLTMTGMTMAVLSNQQAVAKTVSLIQPEFADCLPDLLTP